MSGVFLYSSSSFFYGALSIIFRVCEYGYFHWLASCFCGFPVFTSEDRISGKPTVSNWHLCDFCKLELQPAHLRFKHVTTSCLQTLIHLPWRNVCSDNLPSYFSYFICQVTLGYLIFAIMLSSFPWNWILTTQFVQMFFYFIGSNLLTVLMVSFDVPKSLYCCFSCF